jgi:2,4-dienoyl-CoA reductase (NADPH2)
VANPDLVNQFAAGRDRAAKPCTYCNKCLVHVVEHPIGCYEESRFANRDEMLREVMSVFQPAPFS